MDAYVDQFQAAGGSMVMLAKGNRSRPGAPRLPGPWRLLSRLHRRPGRPPGPGLHQEGRSRRISGTRHGSHLAIEVEDFPAFIVIDDKGNDFFKELNLGFRFARELSNFAVSCHSREHLDAPMNR
jgi:fumarate hydratase class I